MTHVCSYNVNGIRAALRKGLLDWLATERPDVLALQEVRARPDQFDPALFEKLGYHAYWHPAQRPGYSGVALLSRQRPRRVVRGGEDPPADPEGRLIRADFNDFSVLSVYLPSGSAGVHRQAYKFRWLADFLPYLRRLRERIPYFIVTGDFNICHRAIDIHNPKANARSSGFLPAERAWFTDLLDEGFIDSFRAFHPEPHRYSWWSQRPSCRDKNLGWRIDYGLVAEALHPHLQGADIFDQVPRHSDHCPVTLTLR